jgi:hypothetical protein
MHKYVYKVGGGPILVDDIDGALSERWHHLAIRGVTNTAAIGNVVHGAHLPSRLQHGIILLMGALA